MKLTQKIVDTIADEFKKRDLEIKQLKKLVKDAYFEGWLDKYSSFDNEIDDNYWNESDTLKALLKMEN